MDPVTIVRAGNLLEVKPAMTEILGDELSYSHRQVNAGIEAITFGPVQTIHKKCYKEHEGALLTHQGALQRVTRKLDACGIPWVFQDLRPKTILEPDYAHLKLTMPELEFRTKQKEVLATLIGLNSGIIVAPTAYGKTFIMLALTALYPNNTIVISSPSSALLSSTYKRILRITGDVGRVGGGHKSVDRVTLSTFASLMRAPLDRCDILLIDEVHSAAAPEISSTIAKIQSPVKIFGLTATPVGRADNAELVTECLIGPVVCEIGYKEIAAAGDISQIKVAMMSLPRNCCPVQIQGRYKMQAAKKRNGYWRNAYRNSRLADATVKLPPKYGMHDPQTLVLTKTLEHALRLKKLLPDFEVVYGTLSKKRRNELIEMELLPQGYKSITSKRREAMLSEFEGGTLRKIIATGCWGTGIDPVHLEVIVNASGEASSILATQWGGRASRLSPDGKKRFGLLIDCMDEWDTWAQRRAYDRRRTYDKHGWEITKIGSIDDVKELVETKTEPVGSLAGTTSPDA